jgi:hypothetical protein
MITNTASPHGVEDLPKKYASRASDARQIKVHLDRNSQLRIDAIAALSENVAGFRPSASIVVRTALRVMAELYMGDPVGEAAPGQDLLSRIKLSVKGR